MPYRITLLILILLTLTPTIAQEEDGSPSVLVLYHQQVSEEAPVTVSFLFQNIEIADEIEIFDDGNQIGSIEFGYVSEAGNGAYVGYQPDQDSPLLDPDAQIDFAINGRNIESDVYIARFSPTLVVEYYLDEDSSENNLWSIGENMAAIGTTLSEDLVYEVWFIENDCELREPEDRTLLHFQDLNTAEMYGLSEQTTCTGTTFAIWSAEVGEDAYVRGALIVTEEEFVESPEALAE